MIRKDAFGNEIRNIIFLDIDGVLNGDSTLFRSIFWYICYLLHIRWLYFFLDKKFNWRDIYGIHEEKCKRLETICKEGHADIVLTSTWRGIIWDIWNARFNSEKMDYYHKNDPDPYKFVKYCIDHDINIIDRLPYYTNRGTAILDWLNDHKDFKGRYIILDDEWTEMKLFLYMEINPLVLTCDSKPGRPIKGKFYCREGLRKCHVNEALCKLNGYNY